eukprot:TRINITY_DN12245_c0_g2_i3.p1 TRINITY_DN12245_c0_g2~~TRINITY_DN12245_c0_g2_i3.p1  ORF type:complete len:1343 (+),score=373.17 TRINITY_DN12245_c0_g2_i3:47-4030(+)
MMQEAGAQGERPVTPPVLRSPKTRHRHVSSGMSDKEIKDLELKVTNLIVDHPGKLLGFCGVMFVVLTFIGFGIVGFKLSDGELQDRDDTRTDRANAFERMDEQISAQPNGLDNPDAPRQLLRSVAMNAFSFIYEGGPNVLELEKLKFIRSEENLMMNHEEFVHNCPTTWLKAGSACPGSDCHWYRSSWDVTNKSLIQDGSMIICSPQTNSFTWLIWNFAIALTDNSTTPSRNILCNVDTQYDLCVNEGVLVYYTDLYDPTTTYAEKAQVYENGGKEPNQKEIDAYVRVLARLRSQPQYSWMSQFFDKNFDRVDIPATSPERYYTGSLRSSVRFGGPIERMNPKDIKPPCQERTTPDTCNGTSAATKGCVWTPYAGYNKELLACAPDQYHEVSDTPGATINQDQAEDFGDRFADIFDDHYDDVSGPVDVLYVADGILFKKFLDIIMRDALLAIVSFMFVYLYLQIHTGSFFLATLGMIQVIMPFPMGYFVYRVLFQVKAFYGLSGLTLYIVLAIGADDIFVFMDNWVQANVKPRADNCTYLKGRMAHAWKIAGTAMGITSMTTMAAFIATMTSPLLEIGLFGLFAAILVFFDYLLVMTFFACAVVIYHRNYENTLGCCCCGNQMMGKWCNCCTCFAPGTIEDEETPHTPDGYDVDAEPIGCCRTQLTEPRTYETLENARRVLGDLLDHSPDMKTFELAKPETKDDPTDIPKSPQKSPRPKPNLSPAEIDEILANDVEFKRRRIVGLVLLVVAVVVYFIGFIMLQADHDTSSTTYLRWASIIVVGLLVFCGSMNAFRAAKERKVQLGLSESADNFMTTLVAPFLSGTSGIGAKPGVRFVPAIILVAILGFMISRAVQLHPTTKNEQWLPDWHPIQRYMDASHNDFLTNDQEFAWKVQVIIGLNHDPIDRSGTDKYDSDDIGQPVYSDHATKQQDLTSKEFQRFFIEFCDQTFTKSKDPAWYLQRQLLGINDQNCFMRGFKEWVEDKGDAFPVEPNQLVATMWNFTSEQHLKQSRNHVYKPHEVFYDKVLYEFGTDKTQPTGIKAIFMEYNTTLKQWGNAYGDIVDWHDDWDSWLGDINAGTPSWVKNIYPDAYPLKDRWVHASDVWVWMHTQYLLVKGAINGTLVSLGLATGIVTLACFNVLIGFLVLLELLGVVGYVLGMVELLGWELGMIESVAITILVGLSVDYVVHFAVHYNHVSVETGDTDSSFVTERQKRVYEVVSDMGPTVLGGAATSIGAALILFCTWVQFFYKFGVFFLLTIVFSYVFSMLFFLPIMSLIGPENEFLSFRPFLAKFIKCLRTDREAQDVRDVEMTKKETEAEQPQKDTMN